MSFYSSVLFWLLFLSNVFVGFFLFDGWDKSHFMEKKVMASWLYLLCNFMIYDITESLCKSFPFPSEFCLHVYLFYILWSLSLSHFNTLLYLHLAKTITFFFFSFFLVFLFKFFLLVCLQVLFFLSSNNECRYHLKKEKSKVL